MILEKKVEKNISQIQVKVALDKQIVELVYDAVYKEIQAVEIFKGFKKGEAPIDVVKKYTSDEDLVAKSLHRFLDTAAREAFEELKDEKILDKPVYELVDVSSGKFIANFIFTLKPEIKPLNYKNLATKFVMPNLDIDKMVMDDIMSLRIRFADLTDVTDRGIAQGDVVYIDMYSKDLPDKANEMKNVPIEIGRGQILKEFEDKLIGLAIGSVNTISVQIPDDHPASDIRGKNLEYVIKVNSIKKPFPAELNNEFVAKLKINGISNVDQLKAWLEKNIVETQTQQAKNRFFASAFSELRKQADVSFSTNYIVFTANNNINEFEKRLAMDKKDLNSWLAENRMPKEVFLETEKQKAFEQLANGIIFNEIAQAEGIVPKPEDIENEYQNISRMRNIPIEEAKRVVTLEVVVIANINRQVVDRLISYNKL